VVQLGSAAHGAGIAVALAADLLAPVDVGVDLDDAELALAAARVGLEQRDRHRIVAAQQQGHRALRQDLADRLADPLAVGRTVAQVAPDVAAVGDPGAAEDRRHGVEVELIRVGAVPVERATHGRRRASRVARRAQLVGRAVGRAQHRHVGVELGEIGAEGQVAEGPLGLVQLGHGVPAPRAVTWFMERVLAQEMESHKALNAGEGRKGALSRSVPTDRAGTNRDALPDARRGIRERRARKSLTRMAAPWR
jgi:hypothetical protein